MRHIWVSSKRGVTGVFSVCGPLFQLITMSHAPRPGVKGARQKPSEVLVPLDEKFDVGAYIERTEILDHSQLALDKPMSEKTFGQVREVNMQHVLELVDSYRRNPPVQLELTVYMDPGMPSP